ncbi:MAG: RDD family protein [Salibacteraceae bacterium]
MMDDDLENFDDWEIAGQLLDDDQAERQVEYPDWTKRFSHLLIDGLLVITVLWLLNSFLPFSLSGLNNLGRASLFFVVALYFFLTELLWGKTVGKMITRCSVVSDKPTLGADQVLIRTVIKLLIPFSFVTLFTDPQKRTLHDRLSGTTVQKDPPAF